MQLAGKRTDAAGGHRAGQVTRTESRESRSISDVTQLLKMADEELHNLYCKVEGKFVPVLS